MRDRVRRSARFVALSVIGFLSACGQRNLEAPAESSPRSPTPKATVEQARSAESARISTAPEIASKGSTPVRLEEINTVNPEFDRDVKPLLMQACGECHLAFTYKNEFPAMRSRILAAVQRGSMPVGARKWGVDDAQAPAFRKAMIDVLTNYAR